MLRIEITAACATAFADLVIHLAEDSTQRRTTTLSNISTLACWGANGSPANGRLISGNWGGSVGVLQRNQGSLVIAYTPHHPAAIRTDPDSCSSNMRAFLVARKSVYVQLLVHYVLKTTQIAHRYRHCYNWRVIHDVHIPLG
jgi:hypothetical protein